MLKVNLFHGYYLHPVNSMDNEFPPQTHQEISADPARLKGFDIHKDLQIGPTDSTQKALHLYRMVYRPTPLGFSIWIQVRKEAGNVVKPFIPFDSPFKLSFFLSCRKTAFLNFTELGELNLRSGYYYFSNLSQNQDANTATLYLTKPGEHYASQADRVMKITPLHRLDVSSIGLAQVRVKLFKGDENDAPIYNQTFKKAPEEENLMVCNLDLKHIPSGKYTLVTYSIQDNPKGQQEIYLDHGNIPPDAFGIIELLHSGGGPAGPFSFLNAEGALQQPVYNLWWKNRKVRYRYHFDNPQAPAAADSDVIQDNEATPGRVFITHAFIPLTHRYRAIRYQPDHPAAEAVLLPNPEPDRIYPDPLTATLYSEVYMGKTALEKIS